MDRRRGAVVLTDNIKLLVCKKNCYDQYPSDDAKNQDAILECIKTNCMTREGGRKNKSRRNSRKNKRSKRKSQKTAKSNKKR